MSDARAGLKRRVAGVVAESRDELIGISRHLHANPEIRWQEHGSVTYLADRLRASGFAVEVGAGGLETAFVASRGTGARKVAFVAEYDALEGLGHACGHNIIAAAGVGAGIALASLADELDLTVIVVGTPAEEGGGGKIPMLEAGVFDDLEFAMMVHPGPADSVYARPFAVAHFDVGYEGFSAHAAAYPHLGVNASDAMLVAQVAIGLLRQQLPSTVRVHGIVREAGTAPNAIPDSARGSWYVRASSMEELQATLERVSRCFEAGAIATGCSWNLTETSPRYDVFRNDEPLARAFAANAAELGRDMDLHERGAGGMNTASTDMGNISQRVRAIHPYLSIDSLPVVNHQAGFADAAITPAADRALLEGATLLAQTAVDGLIAAD
ncbi:peptidase M20 [Pseudoclavibacter endophyticus]|nr:M20 family metallopeptidase [Pseudoclavibacter endophyticus]GGA66910.1 peptidase M20 [Pseudoclavibacter endophyticus]